MRHYVDLHTHSTASDGSHTPQELIELAEAKRLAAVALTDHDTTDGLSAARAAAERRPKLHFVAGIEISAQFPGGTLHILGLGIDERRASLQAVLRRLRAARDRRNPRIIANLQRMGIDISMDDVLAAAGPRSGAEAGRVVSRMHIAETLRRKGCVRSVQEAFERYVGDLAAAYVDKERLSPREAISVIRAAGGLAFLAHPPQLNCDNRAQLERVVRELMDDGLEGIEVYHTDHTARQTRLYRAMARQRGLAVVGGSDFHGPAKPEAKLGRPRVRLDDLTDDLLERLGLT